MKTSGTKTVRNSVSNLLIIGVFFLSGAFLSSCDIETGDPGNDPVSDPLPEGIYQAEVFSNAYVTRGHLYSEITDHSYDFFESRENTDTLRPLVLLSPGGGWIKYSQLDKLENLSKSLAKRGYAVAIVKYTISDGLPGIDTYINSLKDQQTAIRYFKSQAEILNIDPEKIFIGGWSTGAVISFANAFANEDEIDEIESEYLRNGFSEMAEAEGYYTEEYPEFDHSVKGVLLMMGYTPGYTFLDAQEAPLMIINHKDATLSDRVTKIIGEFRATNIKHFGTDIIHQRALEVGYTEGENLEYIRSENNVTGDFGANYESLSSEYWDEIADFFHRNMDK